MDDILFQIENENEENVNQFLRNLLIPANTLLTCLRVTLARQNFRLAKMVIDHPNVGAIALSSLFEEYSADGLNPEVIYFLQEHLSPADRAMYFRHRLKQRGDCHFYVVDPTEPLQIDEMNKKLERQEIKRDTQFAYLRKIRFLNDSLIDSALGDRRLIVHRILTSPTLRPSQSAIDEAFQSVCRRRKYPVATLLSQHISQQGFDETFFSAIDEFDLDTVAWLLNGLFGFLPTQQRLNDSYRSCKLESYAYSRSLGQRLWNYSHIIRVIEARIPLSVRGEVDQEIDALEKARTQRNRQRQFFHIQETDIHSYSAASIEMPPSNHDISTAESFEEGANVDIPRTNNKLRLNDSVIAHITSRIPPLTTPRNSEETMEEILVLIHRYIPSSQQNAAVHLVGEILNSRTVDLFATTLAFLNAQGSDSRRVLEIWIQGFLSESVVMHSCNPGALERVVTGLRGINDPLLDQIFAQAEAPQLVNIFLKSTFNIFYDPEDLQAKVAAERNAQRLAQELVKRGIRGETEISVIEEALISFATDAVASYDPNIDKYQGEIKSIVEMIVDNYDHYLKNFVLGIIGNFLNGEDESKE